MQISDLKTALGYKWRDLTRDSMADQVKLLNGKANVIFDVGAYNGDTAERYSSTFPEAVIYAFEPDPDSFKALCSKNKLSYPFAISNNEDVVNLYVNKDKATNSLLLNDSKIGRWADNEDSVVSNDVIRVKSTTIDKFCTTNRIKHIDILKLDIQGGEMDALSGSVGYLHANRIGIIYVELLFVPLYIGQSMYHEIITFLDRFGFTLFNLYNFAIDSNGRLKWCDGLFYSNVVLKE